MDAFTILTSFISLLALISLSLIFILIMYALIYGAPFATLAQNRIDTMIKLLKLKKGDKVVDLGSGDGRIVIGFAKLGIEAHGYEINPILVAWSRFKIRQLGLENKAVIHFKSYWSENLSKFNAVTLYGIAHMMPRLEKKLKKELKPKSKIVSNYFSFPNLKPVKEENRVKYYLIPAGAEIQ
jgi:cyclopropane fatty-acyl-phospholipid synthase-like methyltransferase